MIMTVLSWTPYIFGFRYGIHEDLGMSNLGVEIKIWLTGLLSMATVCVEKGKYLLNLSISTVLMVLVWSGLERATNDFELFTFIFLLLQHVLNFTIQGEIEQFLFQLKAVVNIFVDVQFCCLYTGAIIRPEKAYMFMGDTYIDNEIVNQVPSPISKLGIKTRLEDGQWVIQEGDSIYRLCENDYKKLQFSLTSELNFISKESSINFVDLKHCLNIGEVLRIGIQHFKLQPLRGLVICGAWSISVNTKPTNKEILSLLLQYKHFGVVYKGLSDLLIRDCLLLKKSVGNKKYKRFVSDYKQLSLGKVGLCERVNNLSCKGQWAIEQTVDYVKSNFKNAALLEDGELKAVEKRLTGIQNPLNKQSNAFSTIQKIVDKECQIASNTTFIENRGMKWVESNSIDKILHFNNVFGVIIPFKSKAVRDSRITTEKVLEESNEYCPIKSIPQLYFNKTYAKKLIDRKKKKPIISKISSENILSKFLIGRETRGVKRKERDCDFVGSYNTNANKKQSIVIVENLDINLDTPIPKIVESVQKSTKKMPVEFRPSYLDCLKRFTDAAVTEQTFKLSSELEADVKIMSKLVKKKSILNDRLSIIKTEESIKQKSERYKSLLDYHLKNEKTPHSQYTTKSCNKRIDKGIKSNLKLKNRFNVLKNMDENEVLEIIKPVTKAVINIQKKSEKWMATMNKNRVKQNSSINKDRRDDPVKLKCSKEELRDRIIDPQTMNNLGLWALLINSRKNIRFKINDTDDLPRSDMAKTLISRKNWDELKKKTRNAVKTRINLKLGADDLKCKEAIKEIKNKIACTLSSTQSCRVVTFEELLVHHKKIEESLRIYRILREKFQEKRMLEQKELIKF